MKLKIFYSKKTNNFIVKVKNQIFFTLLVNTKINKIRKKYSKTFNTYFYLLKMLRQFGFIKPIKNSKYFL